LLAARTVQVDVDLVQQDVVQEDLVRASVQAGTEARSDIATAQLQTAQARLALVRQQGTEVADQAALANALGLDAGYDVRPVDDAPDFSANPAPVVPLTTYDLAVRRALALRPDYDSSLQSVIASQYSLKEAKLGLFPTLTATGDLETASTNAGGGAFRNTGQIAAGLSIPLFDQGITAANVKNARAELDLSNANLQNEALSVQLSVKQALSNLVTAYAALDQTQVELQTALVVLESTRAQYRAGVTTLPLLLNAEVGITTAAGDRVSAIYAFRQAEQAYLYAIGPNYDFGSAPPPALGAASPQAKK
jgi:outer membrane protein TolC